MDALLSIAADRPMLAAIATLALAWAVTNWFVYGRGQPIGGSARAKDDAVRAARERQQAALAAASGSGSTVAPAPAPKAEPKPAAAMPSRMAAALARAEAAEAAAAAPPAQPTKPSASAMKKKVAADDPNSVTQRLARIERGKGPTDHNPLQGHASGSSAGSSFQCKKKGG